MFEKSVISVRLWSTYPGE